MRDLGKMGENALGLWTGQVGIVCNKAVEDKAGWDYLLQFPLQPAKGDVLSLDRIPPAISCLLQVKATDVLKPPDIKLSNWKRFADPALPSFFLVLNFAGEGHPQEAFLVHVGEVWIGRVIKSLRELPLDEVDALHRHTMRLAWTDNDRLERLNGDSLKAKIEACIGTNSLAYMEKKKGWWQSSGFDDHARCRGMLRIVAEESAVNEQMAEFAIGRLKRLPSTLTSLEEVRFGIPKPILRDLPQEAVLTFEAIKPTRKVVIEFSTATRRARFEADFFASRSVFPFLRGIYDRCRFVCEDFDMVISPEGGTWTISISGVGLSISRSLLSLVGLGELVLICRELGNMRPALSVRIKVEDAEFRFNVGQPKSSINFDNDVLRLAKAASDAGWIARTLDLDPDLRLLPRELVTWHDQLRVMRAILGIDRKSLVMSGEVDATCPDDIEMASPVVTGAFLGEALVIVAAAVHGRPRYDRSPGLARVQFVVPEPSVDVVETVVIEDGRHGSHPTAPYYEKIRAWIGRKGYELLPIAGGNPEAD